VEEYALSASIRPLLSTHQHFRKVHNFSELRPKISTTPKCPAVEQGNVHNK
jgi:hypothetical protein